MHVFYFIGWLGQLIIFLAFYSGVAGLVYARTNLHFKRFTNSTTRESQQMALISAGLWPVAVPWYLLARLGGFVDPNTRAEKKAQEKEAEAQLAERVAKAERKAEEARLQEDLVIRMRARLAGEDLPITAAEQKLLEVMAVKEEKAQLAIELNQAKRELNRYRGYS